MFKIYRNQCHLDSLLNFDSRKMYDVNLLLKVTRLIDLIVFYEVILVVHYTKRLELFSFLSFFVPFKGHCWSHLKHRLHLHSRKEAWSLNELLAIWKIYISRLVRDEIFSFFLFCFFLKGQMLYIPESDLTIFLSYPSVMNLDDLTR